MIVKQLLVAKMIQKSTIFTKSSIGLFLGQSDVDDDIKVVLSCI